MYFFCLCAFLILSLFFCIGMYPWIHVLEGFLFCCRKYFTFLLNKQNVSGFYMMKKFEKLRNICCHLPISFYLPVLTNMWNVLRNVVLYKTSFLSFWTLVSCYLNYRIHFILSSTFIISHLLWFVTVIKI